VVILGFELSLTQANYVALMKISYI
jgi:hypothetical protein